jgi:PilZ domain
MAESQRSHTDMRKHRRRPFQFAAQICIDDLSLPCECRLNDISDGGARILLPSEDLSLPDEFMLLLTHNASIRRQCRIAWREGASIGVKFITPHPARPR